MTNDRLIEWDQLELFVRAERLRPIVRQMAAKGNAPVRDFDLRFLDGEMRVSGKIRKFIDIPFEISIRRIVPWHRNVRVYLEGASAFGFLPVPKLLLHFTTGRPLPPGIEIDAVNAAIVISLDRFLPSFVDATIEQIHITKDGLILRLGKGGADPPVDFGGIDGND